MKSEQLSCTIKTIRIMNLLEKINELRAHSVTPEQFKKMWGYSIEEYMAKMMRFVDERKAQEKK